jgi:hypothetical protein
MITAELESVYMPKALYHVKVAKYLNGAPALQVYNLDGERMLTASVNLEHAVPHEDAIFIKDWSENKGIQLALERAELIGPPILFRATGSYVKASEHMMLGELLEEWRKIK